MVELARILEDVLVPALAALAAAVLVSLTYVVAQRTVLSARRWRVNRIRARYVPALQTATAGDGDASHEAVSILRERHSGESDEPCDQCDGCAFHRVPPVKNIHEHAARFRDDPEAGTATGGAAGRPSGLITAAS